MYHISHVGGNDEDDGDDDGDDGVAGALQCSVLQGSTGSRVEPAGCSPCP